MQVSLIDFGLMEKNIALNVESFIQLNEDEEYAYKSFYNMYLFNEFFQVTIGALRYMQSKFIGLTRFMSTEEDLVCEVTYNSNNNVSVSCKSKDRNMIFNVKNFESICPLDLNVTLTINDENEDYTNLQSYYQDVVKIAICRALAFVACLEKDKYDKV